jgi:hypothetical protein
MADQELQLVHPMRRETMPVAYVNLMLLELCVGGGARQYRSAYSLVLHGSPRGVPI